MSLGGTTPYGDSPKGSMFIDAGGNYSVIVISDGKAKDISYFGTYTVDDANKMLTLHIDASSQSRADGRDLKRAISFNGDELVRGTVKLTWKKV